MDVFRAIADPTRRALLARLAEGPARVVDLTSEHEMSRPAISKHLRLLGEAGLVDAVDVGRERHYSLTVAPLAEVRDFIDHVGSVVAQPDQARPPATAATATPERPAASAPPFDESALDGLDLEVRRVGRDRAKGRPGRSRSTTRHTREDTA